MPADFQIRKRTGEREPFRPAKIKNAIRKAFQALGRADEEAIAHLTSAAAARMAVERGASLVISTDAHSPAHLELMRLGGRHRTAAAGWGPASVWNTLPLLELLERLGRKRRGRKQS